MRSIAVLFLTLSLAACQSTRPASLDPATVEFLLNSASSDFRAHGPAPARFRNVRAGYLLNTDGTKSYRLCGEFQKANDTAWLHFVTLKTSGYEQYIGPETLSYCLVTSIVWDDRDLSTSLKLR